MFMKRIKKSVALALVAVTISGPMFSRALANEGINQNNLTIERQEEIITEYQENFDEEGFKFKENESLNDQEISERLIKMSKEYELNEVLTGADSEFIIAYGNFMNSKSENTETRAINTNKAIKTVKDTKSGITAQLSGSLMQKGGYGITNLNNTFGGNLSLRILGGASKVNTVTATIYHSGFGLIGSNGLIGKVYDDNISDSWSKAPFASNTLNRTRNYTAGIMAMSTHCEMVINGAGTSFDLQGGI